MCDFGHAIQGGHGNREFLVIFSVVVTQDLHIQGVRFDSWFENKLIGCKDEIFVDFGRSTCSGEPKEQKIIFKEVKLKSCNLISNVEVKYETRETVFHHIFKHMLSNIYI